MVVATCQHNECKKHGRDRKGNQRYRCQLCKQTFSAPQVKPIGDSRLPIDRAVMCLRLLLEGNSIRSTSRLTGTHKTSILDLVVLIGERCERFMRATHRDLKVNDVQCDEIWGFVGMKERTRELRIGSAEFGDCYCFTAIERTTKLLVTWHTGKRTQYDTVQFVHNLDQATEGRFQVSTDGFGAYSFAIPHFIGSRVDFGQVIKNYSTVGPINKNRYSPARITSCELKSKSGNPDRDMICTSHVERHNLSIRMGIRRMTRLTNGHSKKLANHQAALALWFAYYNYCRVHMSLKSTPAVAAGLADKTWSVLELLEKVAGY
jgi:transposase-like protein/IS1 family transposase